MTREEKIDKIAKTLKGANSILIFPHLQMDGDALGSATSLCLALRKMGKKAHVMVEDKIPESISFLEMGCCTNNLNVIKNPDVCVCVDCGDKDRFPKRSILWDSGRIKMVIDHHATSKEKWDINLVDSQAAATGELIYEIILAMKEPITKEIGEAIFAAITTDTGNFQYSNVTKKTHQIVMGLYDAGIDSNAVSIALYENETLEKIKLQSEVMKTIETVKDGKGLIAYVSQEMLRNTNTTMEDTEGIVGRLRSIRGVEIASLLKENSKEEIKVTLRSKTDKDVSKIAVKYKGGGHKKAAGCTIKGDLDKVIELMKEEISNLL